MFYVEIGGVHQAHAVTLGAAVHEGKEIARKRGHRLYFDVVPSGKRLISHPEEPVFRRYVTGGDGFQGLVQVNYKRP